MSQTQQQPSHSPAKAQSQHHPPTPPVPAHAGVLARDDVPETGDENEALRERIRALEAQVPAPEPRDGAGYADSDRVTVLHGWPHVHGRNGVTGPSKVLTWFVDGVARNVAYADAKHWRDQFGRNAQTDRWNITILPAAADLPDFAKATGIQPMDLAKLCAMIDAVDADALIGAWTPDRALAFAKRITASLARAGGR